MVRTFFFNQSELNKKPPPELPWLAPKPLGLNGGKDKTVIEIPTKWLGFFQALLLAPGQHSWAKQLLQSNFPQLLQDDIYWMTSLSLQQKPSALGACSLLGAEPSIVKEIEEAIREDNLESGSPRKKGPERENLELQ